MYDVTAIGELLIDFAARDTDAAGYPTMKANPGGAPGNFLAALSKYGLRTAFLGKVGTDAFGGLLINTLQEAGIETKGIRQDSSVFTTLAFVTFDAGGDSSFSFARKPGADTQLSFEELEPGADRPGKGISFRHLKPHRRAGAHSNETGGGIRPEKGRVDHL